MNGNKIFVLLLPLVFFAGCSRQPIYSTGPLSSGNPTPSNFVQPSPESLIQRIPSPDGAYEALIIPTEKSQIYADKQVNFIPASNNIWLFEKTSQDYTQITEHMDYVYRRNILWTSDNRLVFTEGDSNVTEYNPKTKKKKTLLGSGGPMGACVDACGYDVTFVTSPQKKYFIKFFSGLKINDSTIPLEWVNIDSGVTGKIEGQYEFNSDQIKFTTENRFTVPTRAVSDSGMYGDPDFGPLLNLDILMK